VYPDVDFYILKPESPENSSPKASKKRRKQLTENQKTTEYRNINKMGTRFLHLSCQGGGSHP